MFLCHKSFSDVGLTFLVIASFRSFVVSKIQNFLERVRPPRDGTHLLHDRQHKKSLTQAQAQTPSHQSFNHHPALNKAPIALKQQACSKRGEARDATSSKAEFLYARPTPTPPRSQWIMEILPLIANGKADTAHAKSQLPQ
jgi:hypothetical protein